MTAVIVVDAESKFISVFEDMCTALKMHLWPLAQGNQKLPSVDKCHKFINNKKLSYVKIEEGIYLSYKMPKIPNVLGIAHQYKIQTSHGALLQWAENSDSPWILNLEK